ncbi:hypothetical protein BpHYR1_011872 [Brachionus plicatilis]|uniref:Uncharacterized protein n=1 Tax=Brachionus plicatilis TaxID=10195 RepID=A0A3M7SYT4_BRAPC|nr:hypothetical protein BpHYR1_011872 [Brachionus plicatilis]
MKSPLPLAKSSNSSKYFLNLFSNYTFNCSMTIIMPARQGRPVAFIFEFVHGFGHNDFIRKQVALVYYSVVEEFITLVTAPDD